MTKRASRCLWHVFAVLAAAQVLAEETLVAPLQTLKVAYEPAPIERIYDGTVEAVNHATVSAQTAGRIAEVYYDVNDYVEADSPVIRFNDVEQKANARQAEAMLQEARAIATEASDDFMRVNSLYDSKALSKREYDRAVAARDAANARLAAATSALEAARQQAEYTLVRAPYAGIVTERFVEVGESVTVGQPLMSGLSLEDLRVTVDVPQQFVGRVRQTMTAAVITEAGPVTPEGITIFPYADQATNTFAVRLDLPTGQFALFPGMFTKVAFTIGESQRLLVPASAVVRRSEVTGVYVVHSDQTIRLRQIRAGNQFGERVEVLAGLVEGETIALDPLSAGIYAKTTAAQNDAE